MAQKDYFPRLPEIPLEVDEDEETIKIVQLVKSNEPLVSLTLFMFKTAYEVSVIMFSVMPPLSLFMFLYYFSLS